MSSISQELWNEIVAERGEFCEICHWNRATDPHHCIVRRRKGHPEYDVKENIEILCRVDHNDYANSYEHKVGFWARQKQRGYDMKGWYNSLGLKTKERFE